jgi:hypothetical protein
MGRSRGIDPGDRRRRPEGVNRQGWIMGDWDESRPDRLVNARRRIDPGDGSADDDVRGHGMPEIPTAGDGFMAVPRLPRRDRLAGDTEDDVEGHAFTSRVVGQADDDNASERAATADEESPA